MDQSRPTRFSQRVPISSYRPFPAVACRTFMSPISSQAALRTMRSIIASACTPPSLGCQSFFLSCVHRTVDTPPLQSEVGHR